MNFRTLFVVSIIFSTSHARSVAEPECSRYDYDEKVFHKLVRLEHQMELSNNQRKIWEQDMTKREENMKDMIQEMKTLKEVNTKILQEALLEQKEQIKTTITEFHKQVTRMSENLHNEQTKMNMTMLKYKDELKTPSVVFKARGITNKSPSGGDVIIFGTMVTNVGGGYDSGTGYFTAPHAGTYLFTVQLCIHSKKWIHSQIIAAGKTMETSTHYNHDASNTCNSGDAVTVLSKGDQVWNKCYSISTGAIQENINYSWNSFSGVLIHTGTE